MTAVQVYDKGELSEGELSALLRCDRVSAREIVERFLTTTEISDDGRIRRVQLESQFSLLGEKEIAFID